MKRQENVLDRKKKKTKVSTQNTSEPHSVSAAWILDFEYEKGNFMGITDMFDDNKLNNPFHTCGKNTTVVSENTALYSRSKVS